MQMVIEPCADTSSHVVDKLFDDFLACEAKLDVLSRRMACVRPGAGAEDRLDRLEGAAHRQLDIIAEIADKLSQLPSSDEIHIRVKTLVLWNLIKDEEPASISGALLHSLCRDLLAK